MAADRTSRNKALWSGAATVAVLAVVLIVFGLFGPLRSKQPATQTPAGLTSPATSSQALYTQALQAQASGDLTRTVQLAQAAVDADPNNAEAKALLVTARNAAPKPTSTSTPAKPSTPTSTVPAVDRDAAFRKKFENLAALMPTATVGFSFDTPLQFKRDITMSGNKVPAGKTVTQMAWAVHDLKTAAAAKSFVSKTSKKLFPKDAGSITIHGTKAYFGTDGTRFATVSFARGRYAFEVLITVDGVDPKTVKALATAAGTAFPESPTQ